MTTLGIAICAHHSRREMAEKLAAELGCPISMDDGSLGSVVNHDAALRLAAEQGGDWAVVLEDDAQPIPNFLAQADAALAACPCPVSSLYFGYIGKPKPHIVTMLTEGDPHWVSLQGWSSTVCVGVRADYVERLLDVADTIAGLDERHPHGGLPCDHRWGEAAMRLGYWVPHANPSLVQHADEPSLIAGPGPPRRAYAVGAREHWTDRCV